jgi:hypothetical protein
MVSAPLMENVKIGSALKTLIVQLPPAVSVGTTCVLTRSVALMMTAR